MCSVDAKTFALRRFAKDYYHIGNDNGGRLSFACFFSSTLTLLDTFLSAHSGDSFYAKAILRTVKGRKFSRNTELGYALSI